MEFLFIGGTGRCGTTILLDYLANSPDIYSTKKSELKVLTAKNGLLDLNKTKNLDNFNDYINKSISNKEDGQNAFLNSMKYSDLDEILKELNKNFTSNNKESIKDFYTNCFYKQNITKKDVTYLADSTPESIMHSDRIVSIIPNSKFIHMVRDGRDSGYSEYLGMKEYKFSDRIKNEFDGLNHWHQRIVRSYNSLEKLNKDMYINIRIEDFVVHDKQNQKENVMNFLKINNDVRMERFYFTKIKESSMSVGKWQESKNWKEYDKKYSLILEDLKQKNIFIEKYY